MINQRLPLKVTRTNIPTLGRITGANRLRKTSLGCNQTNIIVSTTECDGIYTTMAYNAYKDPEDSFTGDRYVEYLIPDRDYAFAEGIHERAVAKITENLESGTAYDLCLSHMLFGDE